MSKNLKSETDAWDGMCLNMSRRRCRVSVSRLLYDVACPTPMAYLPKYHDMSFYYQAHKMPDLIPDTSLNKCWFCPRSLTTNTTRCPCLAGAIPRPRTYHILSFGQHADGFGCQRLHRSLLEEAILYFNNTREPCAIRVGVGPRKAIIIKNHRGEVRTTIRPPRLSTGVGNSITHFGNAARAILNTDPDQSRGKHMYFHHFDCYGILRYTFEQ
jgi:hypothetical protein